MNLLEHPIYKDIYDLCQEIEKLPPSELQTKLVTMAGALANPAKVLICQVRDLNIQLLDKNETANIFMNQVKKLQSGLFNMQAALRISCGEEVTRDDVALFEIEFSKHECGCEVCSKSSKLCPATQSSIAQEIVERYRKDFKPLAPPISDKWFDWPKTPDGRLLCSPLQPMPIGNGEAHEHRWAHTNAKEVGSQKDGWPSGDRITMECKDCGLTWDAELPQ